MQLNRLNARSPHLPAGHDARLRVSNRIVWLRLFLSHALGLVSAQRSTLAPVLISVVGFVWGQGWQIAMADGRRQMAQAKLPSLFWPGQGFSDDANFRNILFRGSFVAT